MNRSDKIYVAGHRGMVGSAIWRILEGRGFTRLKGQTHADLDLTSQAAVQRFFEQEKPDCVVLAAARVGGIHANNERCRKFYAAAVSLPKRFLGEGLDRPGLDAMMVYGQFWKR